MSVLIDANVLLYAVNESSEHHIACAAFIERCSVGNLCLAWSVIYEFLRVATHPRVFPAPLAPKEALDWIRELIGHPRVDVLLETARHEEELLRVVANAGPLRGSRYHDAHIVTIMRENRVAKIATCDRHFRLFDDIEVLDPRT